MPADHGRWVHDQQHLVESLAIEGICERDEHCTIGRCELGMVDLVLEHSDLMSKGEDLGVTAIAGRDEQADAGKRESDQPRDQR